MTSGEAAEHVSAVTPASSGESIWQRIENTRDAPQRNNSVVPIVPRMAKKAEAAKPA
jgi:hypothetical protein